MSDSDAYSPIEAGAGSYDDVEYDGPEPSETALVHAPVFTGLTNKPDPYRGVSTQPFDEKVTAALLKYQTVSDDSIDIKPNGQLYLTHMKLRSIFNEAFGFGGWGMEPASEIQTVKIPRKGQYGEYDEVTCYREYRLYVHGRFIRQAMGAGQYLTSNRDANLSDAVEAAESFALNRMGKFFEIASNCWDKDFCEEWKRKYAVEQSGKWSKRKVSTTRGPSVQATSSPIAPLAVEDMKRTEPSDEEAFIAPDAPLADGETMTTIKVFDIRDRKDGKKGGWIKAVGGQSYGHFHASWNRIAEVAWKEGKQLNLVWSASKDGKYRNITRLTVDR